MTLPSSKVLSHQADWDRKVGKGPNLRRQRANGAEPITEFGGLFVRSLRWVPRAGRVTPDFCLPALCGSMPSGYNCAALRLT